MADNSRTLSIILQLKDQLSTQMKGVESALSGVASSSTDLNTKLLTVQSSLYVVRAQAQQAFQTIKGEIENSITTYANYERSLDTIVGLVGINRDQVNAWSGDMKALASQVGITQTDLANAMYYITSDGLRGADALNTLKISAEASASGMGDVQGIAESLTSTLNAYAGSGLTAAQAGDILAGAIKEGKLQADTLTPVLGEIIPTASALGDSFADVTGTLAVLSKTGTNAEEGATQINAVFSALLQTTPQVSDALKTVGLTTADLRDELQKKGLVAVMQTLNTAFNGNVEAMRQVFPNVRAFRGVMNALAQDGGAVQSVLDGVKNSTGDLNTAFSATDDTKRKIDQLNVSLNNIQQDIGRDLVPALLPLAKAVEGAAAAFDKFAQAHPKVVTAVLLIAASLTALIAIFASISLAVIGIITLFSAPFVATIGIVIAILAALGASVWAVAGIFDDLLNHGGEVAAGLREYWSEFVTWFEGLWRGVETFFGEAWDGIKAYASEAIDAIVAKFKPMIDLINEVKSGISSVAGAVGSAAGAVGNAVGGAVHAVIPAFASGGIVTKPTIGLIGEAGPEAIIPLNQRGAFGNHVSITITGNTFMADRDGAQKIGDMIVRQLKTQLKLA